MTDSWAWKESEMSGYDYIGAENSSRIRFKRILAILMIVALLAAAAAGVYLWQREKAQIDTMEAYITAVEEKDFTEAIDIYRSIREQALSSDPSLEGTAPPTVLLREIEADIENRLQELFLKLENNEEPNRDQLAYAEGMAEIAGVKLIDFINEQLISYLNGEMNVTQIRRRVSSLLELSNVQPVMSETSQQLDIMAKAVPLVIEAQSYLDQELWYEAHAAWTAISARDDLGSFAIEYAYRRIEHTEERMLQPLLEDADRSIKGGRYVTAASKLYELQTVFPQNEEIQSRLVSCAPYIPKETVMWTEYDSVEIMALRPLIIEPELAFDGDEYAAAANDAMLTTSEFKAMLEQLYSNNYVLVDANSLYNADGSYREFIVPAGKKPLIIVLDSLNYYVTRRESGNAWNLVLDDNEQVSTYYRASNGEMKTEREAEAVGILDAFVEAHPDFSYDGAKGVISLTGYECLFGYVVSKEQADVRNSALNDHGYTAEEWTEERVSLERDQAQKVIDKLKDNGWLFASSTWGNINIRDASYEALQTDTKRWLEQIGSLTGDIDILNYPYGAFVSGSDEKLTYLREQGFRFMTGQGSTPYRIFGSGGLYADKLQISGYGLRQPEQSGIGRLLDASAIYDIDNRP